jgi:hypothetical protein
VKDFRNGFRFVQYLTNSQIQAVKAGRYYAPMACNLWIRLGEAQKAAGWVAVVGCGVDHGRCEKISRAKVDEQVVYLAQPGRKSPALIRL